MRLNRVNSAIDRNERNKLNENFDIIERGQSSIQNQINQLVIEGDSSAEAAQARVGLDDVVYDTLKMRLDAENEKITRKLTEDAQKILQLETTKVDLSEVNTLATAKADKTYVDLLISNVADGSPRDVFYSVSELGTTYPTGEIGTFLVFDSSFTDGAHLFMYKGDAWADLGVYQANGIADSSVTQDKLSGLAQGELFIPENLTNGKYISGTNGSINNNALFAHSDYIEVKGGDLLKFRYSFGSGTQLNHLGAVYDSSKVYIRGMHATNDIDFATIEGDYCYYQLPTSAKFVRVNCFVEYLSISSVKGFKQSKLDFLIVESENITPKAITAEKLSDDVLELIPEQILTPEMIFSKYLQTATNKRIKLLGDSITQGVGGTGFIEDGATLPNTTNKVNTSGVCWANSFRDLCLSKGIGTVKNMSVRGKDSQFYVDNLESYIEPNDDLIILQIGTNDRYTTTSQITLYDNLLMIIDYVRGLGKEIIIMSANAVAPSNDNQTIYIYKMFDVNKTIQQAAYARNMSIISNYNAFLEYEERTGQLVNTLLDDGIHPNDAGYKLMFNNITRQLGIGYIQNGITA